MKANPTLCAIILSVFSSAILTGCVGSGNTEAVLLKQAWLRDTLLSMNTEQFGHVYDREALDKGLPRIQAAIAEDGYYYGHKFLGPQFCEGGRASGAIVQHDVIDGVFYSTLFGGGLGKVSWDSLDIPKAAYVTLPERYCTLNTPYLGRIWGEEQEYAIPTVVSVAAIRSALSQVCEYDKKQTDTSIGNAEPSELMRGYGADAQLLLKTYGFLQIDDMLITDHGVTVEMSCRIDDKKPSSKELSVKVYVDHPHHARYVATFALTGEGSLGTAYSIMKFGSRNTK